MYWKIWPKQTEHKDIYAAPADTKLNFSALQNDLIKGSKALGKKDKDLENYLNT